VTNTEAVSLEMGSHILKMQNISTLSPELLHSTKDRQLGVKERKVWQEDHCSSQDLAMHRAGAEVARWQEGLGIWMNLESLHRL
jgi:hypothetical protein